MNRDEFRTAVFERDKHLCVVPHCNQKAIDAHHIIERKMWKDRSFGYYPENGASLCEQHHKDAENGFIPPQALRRWLKLPDMLPGDLDLSKQYDKWGKELPQPNRYPIKYPHTRYFYNSPGVDKNDVHDSGYTSPDDLTGKPLLVTIKMDGSNVILTNDRVAARNAVVATHHSFDMLKAMHAKFSLFIPYGIELFGEWLYAKHSIHYINEMAIESFLMLFGVYDHKYELFLEWDEVDKFAKLIGVPTVPIVAELDRLPFRDIYETVEELGNGVIEKGHEGIVVRNKFPFHWSKFGNNVGKYVRANHVTTDEHWSKQKIVRNQSVRQFFDAHDP